MMRRMLQQCGAVVAVLAVVGCSSTKVAVTTDPPDVAMRLVEVGTSQAQRQEDGTYVSNVEAEKGASKAVEVLGTTADGVTTRATIQVEGGITNEATLPIPADVEVRIASGTATSVRIGDKQVSPGNDGLYRRSFFPGAETPTVEVHARDLDGNVDAREATLTAGRAERVVLHLGLTAAFDVDRTSVLFGEPVVFNASESTPSGSLLRYIWDFGDGSPPLETSGPHAEYRYTYEPEVGDQEREYVVSLKVATANGVSASVPRKVTAKLGRKDLAFDLEVYPRRGGVIHPGETLQFKLTPRDGFAPADIENVSIAFGDGERSSVGRAGEPLVVRVEDGDTESLIVEHEYAQPGMYTPVVTYSHATPGLEGPYTARLHPRGGTPKALTVARRSLTDAEMKDKAWEALYAELDEVLRTTQPDGAGQVSLKDRKLVLTSLDNANFETEKKFVEVVERLTHMMVQGGYHIVEKSTPVLARLAPEAVVDVSEEVRAGKKAADSKDFAYLPNLDYGLVTGADRQTGADHLSYGLKLEGTKDRLLLSDTSRNSLEGDSQVAGDMARTMEASSKSGQSAVAQRNLPVLVARFDTAENVIALRVVEEPEVQTTSAVRYSGLFERPLDKRTAKVKVRVRILERTGRVLDARDIEGEFSELVVRGFEQE